MFLKIISKLILNDNGFNLKLITVVNNYVLILKKVKIVVNYYYYFKLKKLKS